MKARRGSRASRAGDVVEAGAAPSRALKRSRRPSLYTVIGVFLLVVGLGFLGALVYDYASQEIAAKRAIEAEREAVRRGWGEATGEGDIAIPGAAVGLMRIPALGADYEAPIVSGFDDASLDKGIGWLPSSAKPGQVGNFVLSGHHGLRNMAFSRLKEVPAGSEIIVETRTHVYTYVLDKASTETTVANTETWVLDPVPGQKGVAPTEAKITLITCTELTRSPLRSVAFGHLIRTEVKS